MESCQAVGCTRLWALNRGQMQTKNISSVFRQIRHNEVM
jgi:hypothetical protein